ncbi:pyridoxal 5'-phosphate synthase glutaminase subunit PdxT [Candidatus Hecatella orcuttiae]|jgi:5'-phosphate synthase pdxT subunit|uniref:pyridoxal 5'-phosphate synthase glutaminase subunit PdxT n=1 Tax=Candidatus Hecatella orcuttiae TaxID=1935119 RepID=UPI002867B8CC|nr:pyridoxal 5'-phosphate synthase glutaminase subunit PdxT [Candidatus Hecatella orcuttiae]
MASVPELKIGVIGLQGAVAEHVEALNSTLKEMKLKGAAYPIKRQAQIEDVHGLVIPGGESTTIGRLLQQRGMAEKIVKAAEKGTPILGTCAGLILMAKEVYDAKVSLLPQPLLGLMDMKVVRNAFGRQRESFEDLVDIPLLGRDPYPGVFIRSPLVERVWGENEAIGRWREKIVAVQQGNLLATAFHPELSRDRRFLQYFVKHILDAL